MRASPGACECEGPAESAAFFHIGAQGFQRQRLGKGPVALLDPNAGDTGLPADPAFPVAQSYNDQHRPLIGN